MNEWYFSESDFIPSDVDSTSSKNVVYLRKDIQEVIKTNDDGENYTVYQYYERKISHEEWASYKNYKQIDENAISVENLKEENQMLNEQISMLTECLLEMSELVYA